GGGGSREDRAGARALQRDRRLAPRDRALEQEEHPDQRRQRGAGTARRAHERRVLVRSPEQDGRDRRRGDVEHARDPRRRGEEARRAWERERYVRSRGGREGQREQRGPRGERGERAAERVDDEHGERCAEREQRQGRRRRGVRDEERAEPDQHERREAGDREAREPAR